MRTAMIEKTAPNQCRHWDFNRTPLSCSPQRRSFGDSIGHDMYIRKEIRKKTAALLHKLRPVTAKPQRNPHPKRSCSRAVVLQLRPQCLDKMGLFARCSPDTVSVLPRRPATSRHVSAAALPQCHGHTAGTSCSSPATCLCTPCGSSARKVIGASNCPRQARTGTPHNPKVSRFGARASA